MKVIANSIEQTQEIARLIAPKLVGGDILLLRGDLGAGKTTFTKALCEALGVSDMVTSPTFTIVNEYDGKYKINHFDMYRIDSIMEAMEFGFDEMIGDVNSINIIEWPDVVMDILPSDVKTIEIRRVDDNTREIHIKGVEI